jgi:hypothetical protein
MKYYVYFQTRDRNFNVRRCDARFEARSQFLHKYSSTSACHAEDIIDIGNPSSSGYPEKYQDIRKCGDIQKL